MSRIVIFILTTTSALAALRPVDGQSDVKNVYDSSYIVKTTSDINLKTTPVPGSDEKWLIYASAGPTVLIFILCVIVITVKNCSTSEDKYTTDQGSFANTNLSSAPSNPMNLLKPAKPKIINEVYDKMLEQFKDDKNKNKTFVGRKCSQITIQGVESGSPKSLARKHIIIGKMNKPSKEEDINEIEEDPLRTLIKSSTSTFLGGPLIKEMKKNESLSADTLTITDTVSGILSSFDNLTETDRRTYCDELNEVLLPQDLEEAFRNFESWAESYA